MKGIDFLDNVVVALQKPGEVFSPLPDSIKQQIQANLDFIKSTNPTTDKYRSVPFDGGAIPAEFARALSHHILEAGYSYGSKD